MNAQTPGFGPFDFARELAEIDARRSAMTPQQKQEHEAEQRRRLAEFDALVVAGGAS